MGLLGMVLQYWGSWMSTLGSLFPQENPQENLWPSQCSTIPPCGRGHVVKVKLLLLPFQYSPSQFCGSERYFNLTPAFWEFYSGVFYGKLLVGLLCEGDQNDEQPMLSSPQQWLFLQHWEAQSQGCFHKRQASTI